MTSTNINKVYLIDRLLKEEKITLEEAKLLNEDSFLVTPEIQNPLENQFNDWIGNKFNHQLDHVQKCPCNPKNGGSGLCNCTLATPVIIS